MNRRGVPQHHSWLRRHVPPLTPLRIDRYRYVTQNTLADLHARVLSDEGRGAVKVKASRGQLDRAGDVLTFRVIDADENQRHWPQLIAHVTARTAIDGATVEVETRMNGAQYTFDAAITVIVALVLYGVGQDIVVAGGVFCLALLFMHVRFLLTRQWPEDLAMLVTHHFDLSPVDS